MEFILSFLWNAFAFIIILSIVVFIHELGHYLFAVRAGVKVEQFSIGFGKELIGWTDKRSTRWKICVLPFGGYVQMFADDDVASSKIDKTKLDNISEEDKQKILFFKPVKDRIMVAIAGPVFNFLLAIFVLTFVYSVFGLTKFAPIITDIAKDGPAEKANLMIGDRVLEINGEKISTFDEIIGIINLNVKESIIVKIDRNGAILEKEVFPEYKPIKNEKYAKVGFIGIASNKIIYQGTNPLKAFSEAIKSVYGICSQTLIAIGQMIVGSRGLDSLSGPVKIAKYSGESMSNGLQSMLVFLALISTSLGLMNILPIPGLDGGHLLFYIIEIIRRKPLEEKVQNLLLQCGFYILIFLMSFATLKDIFEVF